MIDGSLSLASYYDADSIENFVAKRNMESIDLFPSIQGGLGASEELMRSELEEYNQFKQDTEEEVNRLTIFENSNPYLKQYKTALEGTRIISKKIAVKNIYEFVNDDVLSLQAIGENILLEGIGKGFVFIGARGLLVAENSVKSVNMIRKREGIFSKFKKLFFAESKAKRFKVGELVKVKRPANSALGAVVKINYKGGIEEWTIIGVKSDSFVVRKKVGNKWFEGEIGREELKSLNPELFTGYDEGWTILEIKGNEAYLLKVESVGKGGTAVMDKLTIELSLLRKTEQKTADNLFYNLKILDSESKEIIDILVKEGDPNVLKWLNKRSESGHRVRIRSGGLGAFYQRSYDNNPTMIKLSGSALPSMERAGEAVHEINHRGFNLLYLKKFRVDDSYKDILVESKGRYFLTHYHTLTEYNSYYEEALWNLKNGLEPNSYGKVALRNFKEFVKEAGGYYYPYYKGKWYAKEISYQPGMKPDFRLPN